MTPLAVTVFVGYLKTQGQRLEYLTTNSMVSEKFELTATSSPTLIYTPDEQ